MRHEKTVSVSKIKPLWEPWEEDETPRKTIPPQYIMQKLRNKISSYWQLAKNTDNGDLAKILRPENIEE